MGVGTLRNILAPAVLGVALATSSAQAARAADDEPRKITLYPFAEDAEAAPAKGDSPAKPAAPRAKSNFQPRFKAPAARRAAHTEPVEGAEGGSSGPVLDPPAEEAVSPEGAKPATTKPAADKPQATSTKLPAGSETPQGLLEEAYAKSKTAATEAAYDDIIGRCRRAGQLGLKPPYEEYSHQLMAWAYNRRGEQRAAEKHDKEALDDFESAVKLNPRSWRAIHNRGVSYAALGKTTEALADFEQTVQLNARYPNVYYNRAQLRYAQGNYRGAADDYTAAMELGPPDAATLNNRGHAFQRLQRYGDALRDYAQALQVDPAYSSAMINRGEAYCELGRYGEAAKEFQDAVEADPKSGRAYQAVAWLMATCPDEHYRNTKLAVEAARKALELDGESAGRDLETLAAAQANAGQFSEAKATQEKAIAKIPRTDLVAAEKRMGLYQRDVAFRQSPQPDFAKPEDEDEKAAVKRASAVEKKANARAKMRTKQAQVPSYPFQR